MKASNVRVLVDGVPLEPVKSFRFKKPRELKLRERIALAMVGKISRSYFDLMRDVFPVDRYPRAYRSQSNGGPPGCAMAFGRALRQLGATWSQDDRVIYPTREMRKIAASLGAGAVVTGTLAE